MLLLFQLYLPFFQPLAALTSAELAECVIATSTIFAKNQQTIEDYHLL